MRILITLALIGWLLFILMPCFAEELKWFDFSDYEIGKIVVNSDGTAYQVLEISEDKKEIIWRWIVPPLTLERNHRKKYYWRILENLKGE